MAKGKKKSSRRNVKPRFESCAGCGKGIDLNNNSDWVVLYDAQTQERNLVHYATEDGWPCADKLGERDELPSFESL
jgi:hypothetical protein